MTEIPEIEAPEHGPKMAALRTDTQRRFAWLLACGLEPIEAAREAGFSDPGGDSSAIRVRTHEMMHHPKVHEAIEECSRLVMRGLGPVAVRAARAILENPKHPFHGRMVETILDRTGFQATTQHKVTVEHTVDTRELEALARRLAQESGIDPRRLLGTDATVADEKVIEHEAISNGSDSEQAG